MNSSFAAAWDGQPSLWQAPLPFDCIPAAFSGKISAAGAAGVLRIAPQASLEDVAQQTLNYGSQPVHYAFAHAFPEAHAKRAPEALAQLEQHFRRKIHPPRPDDFEKILQQCLPYAASIGFMHGIPEAETIAAIQRQGVRVYAYCRNVLEALTAERFGVDFLVLQGVEAGGERVGFHNDLPDLNLPGFSLLQQVRRLLRLPLLLWGDFSGSEDMTAALLCGAQGVMLDRVFLACKDSQLTEAQRQRAIHAHEYDSQWDGRWTQKKMRCVPSAELPHIAAEEALWAQVLEPQSRPLPLSLSPITDPQDFDAWFAQLKREMQNHLL